MQKGKINQNNRKNPLHLPYYNHNIKYHTNVIRLKKKLSSTKKIRDTVARYFCTTYNEKKQN